MSGVPHEPGGASPAAAGERPPTGNRALLYALVIGALVVDLAALYWLSERYR